MKLEKIAPWIAVVGFVVLILWWMRMRAMAGVDATNEAVPDEVNSLDGGANAGFYAPYYWNTPGVSDNPALMNGQATPYSEINVTVNPDIAQFLANAYMPMFGMTGVTTALQ